MIAMEVNMAQLLVRNLEDRLKSRLQHLARRHGRSMEAEAREILRNALREEETQTRQLGSEIAALFRGIGLDEEIPELRGHTVTPMTFEP
jgi:plasmid stability protein